MSLDTNDSERSFEQPQVCIRTTEDPEENILVAGLINTGNSCFLNSVLQALSSLPSLHAHLNHIGQLPLEVPLPVTRSLLKTLRLISKPLQRRSAFRPIDIVTSMSFNRQMINREQQDAQEAFQLISGAVEAEWQKINKMELIGNGLKEMLPYQTSPIPSNSRKHWIDDPFTGLLANRLACMQCGYTAAIRHFSFNNIQLTLPNTYTTTLEDCLRRFASIEYLHDASCRKCSFIHTMQSLSSKLATLNRQVASAKSAKKKKAYLTKLVELERIHREIENRLMNGRIEEEPEDTLKEHLLRAVSRLSTKQVMVAKPPKILCLHLSRSAFHTSGALYKNTCQLAFPEYLDMTPYCTNGTLHTQCNIPISTTTTTSTSTGKRRSQQRQTNGWYRLMSAVVHYGSHSYGHFVTYKRRIVANHCGCTKCGQSDTEEKWKGEDVFYRISDTKVDLCSLDTVLHANPYMLLYEWTNEDEEDGQACLSREEEKQMDTPVSITSSSASMAMLETMHEKEKEGDHALMSMYYDDASLEALKIANSLLMQDQEQQHKPLSLEEKKNSSSELPAAQDIYCSDEEEQEDRELFNKRQSGRRKRSFVGGKKSGRNSWEDDHLVSVRE
ncbi:hypothetical protein EC973_003013 [Apophysomyces ossiformis]|uniref:ubiquitinyl hydrolase 1 n=1 Tax=Apophysomyces ossiformis TaxID=679940 RepID=A0A8H7ETM2_9FUNG|nr:hypothetical protein EC973_003013 [Apophysomyces ossiformis]